MPSNRLISTQCAPFKFAGTCPIQAASFAQMRLPRVINTSSSIRSRRKIRKSKLRIRRGTAEKIAVRNGDYRNWSIGMLRKAWKVGYQKLNKQNGIHESMRNQIYKDLRASVGLPSCTTPSYRAWPMQSLLKVWRVCSVADRGCEL